MGKTLSRPGCLRQSPCCSKKSERDGYNEDGYIPQRSIYDTMCINEHIDHSSAHSTLGSRRGRETDFPSNRSLGGDNTFDARSSVFHSGARRLDERFIFDSLKLANDELRSEGGFGRSVSPSMSCSSAPSGSVAKRYHYQDPKKDSLCRHSWKVLTPPKTLPEPLQLSPGEKNLLNPGVAFFPSSMTSPQISPFSGSPFSTGTHTPSVFFSPSPIPYHQQFQRQPLPTQPSSPRPNITELSVSALMCGPDVLQERRIELDYVVQENALQERSTFGTFKPKPQLEPVAEQLTSGPEPENETVPLMSTQIAKSPRICTTPIESTWPRRLIGKRRTVRQGGVVHNLPILPPLPSMLIRSVSDKKPMPRLSPFSEHQGQVEGRLSKSLVVKKELNDCSIQDWNIFRETMEHKARSSKNVTEAEEVFQSPMPPVEEKSEHMDENVPSECEENWEAVLEMVNSLWDETWKDSDSQNFGSLRRWPLLNPPTGFGGSQAPSGASSELGAEDLKELERICREDSIDSELEDVPYSQPTEKRPYQLPQLMDQSLDQPSIPTMLDLKTAKAQLGSKYGQTGSPDSNLTLESDSSGVYMSNTSQSSREDMCDVDSVGVTPSSGDEKELPAKVTWTCKPKLNNPKQITWHKMQSTDCNNSSKDVHLKRLRIKSDVYVGSKSLDKSSISQNTCCTVNTPEMNTPLLLSPSKHEIKGHLLDCGDLDPFVATDSFVYLPVLLPAPSKTTRISPHFELLPAQKPRSGLFPKPGLCLDECDFLSTDSFVYLSAPDCHLLSVEGRSVYGDSDSEDSGSRADFVQPSAVGGSDWGDSDLSDSDAEWDHWEELEQGVLQGLFHEEQLETEEGRHGDKSESDV